MNVRIDSLVPCSDILIMLCYSTECVFCEESLAKITTVIIITTATQQQ